MGTLVVVLEPGYTPVSGDSFDILSAGSLTGLFGLDLPDLGPNYRWQVDYLLDPVADDIVRLGVVPDLAADFDRDGDVDGSDLSMFDQCVSGPGVAHDLKCSSRARDMDFDSDTDIDLLDFGIFQRCYSGAGIVGDPTCDD